MSAIDKRIRIMLWGVAIVVIVGGVFLAVRLWNLDWPVLMAILSVFGIMKNLSRPWAGGSIALRKRSA